MLTNGQDYYWRIDEVNGVEIATGTVWNFTAGDGKAYTPLPQDEQSYVSINTDLSWASGIETGTYDVYLGTNYDDVNNATTASAQFMDNVSSTTYNPSDLELGQTYYWRVDDVDALQIFKGDVWSFSTAYGSDFGIDNFDDYTSTTDLKNTWSEQGNATIYQETNEELYTYRYLGMQLDYANGSSPYVSEARRSYGSGQDWTADGVQVLVFYYLGDDDVNGLYVTLADSSDSDTVYITDTGRLRLENWQEMNFKLSDFNGIDLTDVRGITVGIGQQTPAPGGNGTVYIDEIAAFPSRCTAEFDNPADLDGDCELDQTELKWLVDHWLMEDYIVLAADPGTSGLVAYYNFNETSGTTLNDSTANNYDGTVDAAGSNDWDSSGYIDGCLDFDGTFGVTLPTSVFSGLSSAVTVSVWVNSDATEDAGKPGVAEMGAGQLPGGATEYQWDTAQYRTGTPDDFAGSWHHWAFVKDGDNDLLQIYHDGILVSEQTDATNTMANTISPRIGSAQDGSSEYFRGKMDEMKIYNRVLSHSEIVYLADLSQVDQPLAPVLSPVDPKADGVIDFADFAWVALDWLDQVLWP